MQKIAALIVGNSKETKPLCQGNTIFWETDTGDLYIKVHEWEKISEKDVIYDLFPKKTKE